MNWRIRNLLRNDLQQLINNQNKTEKMKRTFALLTLIVLSTVSFAQTVWKNDKAHSKLTFTITHLGVSDVLGLFKNFDVTATSSKDDFSDAVFELTAQTASVNTEVDMRDNHLKSADFFNVEKYPTMTFKSTSIKKAAGKDKYVLTGNLTILDITKPVSMNLWYRGTVTNPMSKKPDAGFQLTGTIKRSDFNLGGKYPPPMLSDEVEIKADGEFGHE